MFYICAVCKEEGTYLKEWLDHHLNIGVDKIYLYEEGSYSHEYITKDYDKVVLNKMPENKSHFLLQKIVYNNFIKEIMKLGDWCAFIDIDEFIMGMSVQEIITSFSKYDEIPLFWKTFNANGHIEPVKSQIKEFTELIKNKKGSLHHDSKSIIQKRSNSLNFTVGTHHIRMSPPQLIKWNQKLQDKLWLNHYYTRSLQDWEQKVKKGAFREFNRKLSDFYKYNPSMLIGNNSSI